MLQEPSASEKKLVEDLKLHFFKSPRFYNAKMVIRLVVGLSILKLHTNHKILIKVIT